MAEQLKDRKTNSPRHRLSKVNPSQVEFSKLKKRQEQKMESQDGNFLVACSLRLSPNLSSSLPQSSSEGQNRPGATAGLHLGKEHKQ